MKLPKGGEFMFKKLTSIILAVTIILTITIPVLASDSVAEPKLITYFYGEEPSTPKTSGSFAASGGSLNSKPIYLSGNGAGSASSVKDGENYYIESKHSYLLNNYYSSINSYLTDTNPVSSVKYDICIPKDDNDQKKRIFTLDYSSSSSSRQNYTLLTLEYENGEFKVASVTEYDSTAKTTTTLEPQYSVSADYAPGNWTTVDVRAFRTSENKLEIGVYIGDKQIYYAAGNLNVYSTLAIWQLKWTQDNPKDANKTPILTNYLDNIVISTIDAIYKPLPVSNNNIETSIINFDFSDGTEPTSSTIATSNGSITTKFQQSSQTGRETSYELDNSALVVTVGDKKTSTSNDFTYLTQVARNSLLTYVNNSDETILETSYKIYIPENTERAKRQHSILFAGSKNANGNATSYFQEELKINSEIENGYISFSAEPKHNAKPVDLKERYENAPVSSNQWHTVKYLMKINYDNNNYSIKLFGIIDDVCYYENEFSLAGNGFGICGNQIYIYGIDNTEITTKYDDIKLCKITSFVDETKYNQWKQDYIYPISLTYNATTGVTAKGRVDNSNGSYNDKLCLSMAIYNEYGKLEKLWTDYTLDDGYLICSSDDLKYIKPNYTVKAFLFDSLQSAVPYVESKKITLAIE